MPLNTKQCLAEYLYATMPPVDMAILNLEKLKLRNPTQPQVLAYLTTLRIVAEDSAQRFYNANN
jgi:hypothetical protein